MIITIQIMLVFLSFAAKSVMDTLQFHYDLSLFTKYNPLFWNPAISWRNKWKNGIKANGEKFLFSSTLLVWTTDAWHLFQFIFLNSICYAMALSTNITQWTIVDFIIIRLVGGVAFWLGYEKLLILKKWTK